VESGSSPTRDGAASAYRAAMAGRVADRAAAACAVLGACAACATVFEIMRFPERRIAMLATDAWFAVVIAVSLGLLRWRRQAAPEIMVTASILVGLTLSLYHASVGASVAMAMWVLTALVATTAAILPWGWRHQAMASAGALVGYPLLLPAGTPEVWTWAAGGAYLAWVFGLSVAAAALIDQYLRTDFDLAARLSEREARLQSYFDLALVGTAVLSSMRAWIEVNDEFCRILGQRRERLLGASWPEFVHPDDRATERTLFASALAPNGNRAIGELRLTRADGELVQGLVSMRGLPGPAGAIDHVMVLVQDITERSQREAALRHAKETAEADRRDTSAFLALMSHELRTPMTIISGMTDVVLGGELAPDQRRVLQKTKAATRTVVSLVNDVLDLSRIEAGRLPLRPRSMEVRSWLAEVLQPLAWVAEQRGLRLESAVDDDVPVYLVADPDRLRQIVVNLIDNAVKFTREGAVLVTVSTAGAGLVRLTVADTGIGIPADRQESIFEAFTQLDTPQGRRHSGSGLGLSICRRIVVDLMGGRIAVESREGEGSRFHVTIPVVAAEETRPGGISNTA